MAREITDQYLRSIIDQLKKSAKKNREDIRPGRRRFGIYGYLRDVYRIFLDLHSRRIANKAACRIIELLQLTCRKNAHPIRVLIEASIGPEDNRAKSRWTQSLKYAHGWLMTPERMEWFFKTNGGISGSAALLAIRDGTDHWGNRGNDNNDDDDDWSI